MKKSTWIILGSVVVALLLIVGGSALSGGSPGGTSPIGGHNGTAQVGNANNNNPELAPDFTLERFGGGNITLSDYIGVKPVIIDFWATWCPNCRRDMPKLSRMYDKYKDDVEVIGVNLQERERLIAEYIEELNITFPIALDPRSTASRAYGVQYTNFHVLINKDGTVNGIVPGDISEGQVTALIEANS